MIDFDRTGIVKMGHHLGYGSDHGALLDCPMWIKRVIVNVWNPFACYVWGHDICGPWDEEGTRINQFCSACSKEWK
jgi:hypothetical protein